MSIETEKGHSEEYFSAYRDHWWNNDFLELMAKRWNLKSYSNLLDVGCGEFHWSRLLCPFMNYPEIIGLDNDPKWSANDISEFKEYFPTAKSIKMISGSAESLPFPDNYFDVVTCQTLLIHSSNPEKVILEMKRVLNPNGIVICIEPNNMAAYLSITSLESIHAISEMMDSAKIYLYEQYGKYLSGMGYNSIGDLIPLFLKQSGFKNIQTYLSDKCTPLIPPYITQEEKDTIKSMNEWIEEDTGPFNANNSTSFITKSEEVLGDIGIDLNTKMENDIKITKKELINNILYSPGSTIMYLVSGKKY